MARCVVALPELAQRVLSANIPYFEVHVWESNSRNILADGRDSFQFRGGGPREEEGLHLFVEGGFAGIVET